MTDFQLKTKYLFGKDSINNVVDELRNKNYSKALILYGKGSVKRNGSFNELVKVLDLINLKYVEFSGIEPNPRHTTIDKCVKICRDEKVDIIFALGGGSVVDASKVIGILTTNDSYENSWEYVLDQSKIVRDSVDIISIITLAGTASENNSGSVITNEELNEKKGVFTPSAIPMIAIEDPKYTYSVNKWHTASGIFDCFSHLLEQYLGRDVFEWTKQYIFANLRVILNYAKVAVNNPDNYDARANILWTSSMALNGLASFESDSDWNVHVMEHAFSGLWDITHGAGLALITPTYLKIRSNREMWFKNKIIELGINVFGTQSFDSTVEFIYKFIESINLPTSWKQFEEIKEFTDNDVNFLVSHSKKFGDPRLEDLYREVILNIKENK